MSVLSEVHEIQDEKRKREETIATARGGIATAREKIAAATIEPRPDLYEKRKSLRASHLLGEDVTDDLAAINASITRHEEETAEAGKVIGLLKEDISDLESRIATEEEGLRKASAVHDSRKKTFVRDLMEQHGAKYIELAHALNEELASIVGLNMLCGDENPAGISQATPFVIPVLRLRCFDGMRGRQHVHEAGELTGAGKGDILRANVVERLRDMGVVLEG